MKKYVPLAVALAYSGLMIVVVFLYRDAIITGKAKPVLTTWLLFFVAISLGLWTYWHSEEKRKRGIQSLLNNIINTWDTIFVVVIMGCVIVYGKVVFAFGPFDIVFGLLALGVFAFYVKSKNDHAANHATNALLMIGYLPTYAHVVMYGPGAEPLLFWSLSCAACVVGAYNAFVSDSWLAKIYAVRAVVSSALVIALVLWVEHR